MSRDWHEWYQAYDDPSSSLSRRLRTVRAGLRELVAAADPPSHDGDPADLVRRVFDEAGFEEVGFVSDPSRFRVGVHRWPGAAGTLTSDVRMLDFV